MLVPHRTCQCRHDGGQGDEGKIRRDQRARDKVRIRLPQNVRRQGTHIDALEDTDSSIVSQALIKLAVADIDGIDVSGPTFEETVGKASGRSSCIERRLTVGVDAEPIECAFKFLAASADETRRWAEEFDWLVGRHKSGRFIGCRASDNHDPGRDGVVSFGSCGHQAPSNQLGVEPATGRVGQLVFGSAFCAA